MASTPYEGRGFRRPSHNYAQLGLNVVVFLKLAGVDSGAEPPRERIVIDRRPCSNLTSIPSRRPFRSGDAATRRHAERRDAPLAERR
ncbi:hypothetical protein [Candidatus Binatus sp.]|uniref:hypothetical protein n=1 Tax=Candidatus Binatus sp. TaxID=2811406 RepID=UPI002FD9C38B